MGEAVARVRPVTAAGDPLDRLGQAVMELYDLCSPSEVSEQPLFLEFAQRLLVDAPGRCRQCVRTAARVLRGDGGRGERGRAVASGSPPAAGRHRRCSPLRPPRDAARAAVSRSPPWRCGSTACTPSRPTPSSTNARVRSEDSSQRLRVRLSVPRRLFAILVRSRLSRPAMDARPTTEQRELEDAAARLAEKLGPTTVGDLDDDGRRSRLDAALPGRLARTAHRHTVRAARVRCRAALVARALATRRLRHRVHRTAARPRPAAACRCERRRVGAYRRRDRRSAAGSRRDGAASPSMPPAAPSALALGGRADTPGRGAARAAGRPASISPAGVPARRPRPPVGSARCRPTISWRGRARRDPHRGGPRRGDGGRARSRHRVRPGA